VVTPEKESTYNAITIAVSIITIVIADGERI